MTGVHGTSLNIHQPASSSTEQRPVATARQCTTVDIRIPGLVESVLENNYTDPARRVFLSSDLSPEYRDQSRLNPAVLAWNQDHVFLRHPDDKSICTPNYRGTSSGPAVLRDGITGQAIPQPGAIKATDPSHCMAALHTHAEFRLNAEHRLMGYSVNGKLVPSLLPNRGLYALGAEHHLPGQWMYCKNVPRHAFAPYAVMLALEGKRTEEVTRIANTLIDGAETEVSDYSSLHRFLSREAGALKPVSVNLCGKSRSDTIQQIAQLLNRHQRAVLLVTGDRARLVDAVGITEQGRLTLTFRDAYVGAQRTIPDHDDFWWADDRLPRIFDRLCNMAQQDTDPSTSRDVPLHGAGDYLVYMVSRTPPPTDPKPRAGSRV
jgi:hypothetical protein